MCACVCACTCVQMWRQLVSTLLEPEASHGPSLAAISPQSSSPTLAQVCVCVCLCLCVCVCVCVCVFVYIMRKVH